MNDDVVEFLTGNSEFERDLYNAAMQNLEDKQNKLRFNNFAYAMRELARHILKRLAPDDEVLKCVWYKNEIPDKDNGITRVQRAVYATQGGLSNHYVQKRLRLNPKTEHRALQAAIDKLSKYTHIAPHTFDLSAEEVDRLVTETLDALEGLAVAIVECRGLITGRLYAAIHDGTIEQVVCDSLPALDCLATHYSLEQVQVYHTGIRTITHDTIHLFARGHISVTLQWGSNSDLRNGDGAEIDQDFDFICELTCPVDNPSPGALEFEEDSVQVDTSSWRSGPDEWDDLPTEPEHTTED